MLQTSANPTRRINASSGFYYAVLPSFAGRPFILVTCPYLLPVRSHLHVLCVDRTLESCLCKIVKVHHSSNDGLSAPCLGCLINLSTQHLGCGRAADIAATSWASLCRNANGHADSFWFGHLSRHWSPCGADRWTVTSEWKDIGMPPLARPSAGFRLSPLPVALHPTLCRQAGPHQRGRRLKRRIRQLSVWDVPVDQMWKGPSEEPSLFRTLWLTFLIWWKRTRRRGPVHAVPATSGIVHSFLKRWKHHEDF